MVFWLNYRHKLVMITRYKCKLQYNNTMKSIKTTFLSFLLIAAFTSILYSGCEPVDNNTTGDDPRDPYIGEWNLIESFKSTEGQSYSITISKDPNNSSQVIIGNLGNPGSQDVTVIGVVTSSQVVVSSQSMSNKWVIEGAGRFSNVAKTIMTWNYSITAGGNKDDYSATASQ